MKPIFRTDPLLFTWHAEWAYVLLLLWSLACCYGCNDVPQSIKDKQAADALAQEAAAASIDAHTVLPGPDDEQPVVVPTSDPAADAVKLVEESTFCRCSDGCTCYTVNGSCMCRTGGTKCCEGCNCGGAAAKEQEASRRGVVKGIPDSWFYCLFCQNWSHYFAPNKSQLLTKCKHCERWAYRTLDLPPAARAVPRKGNANPAQRPMSFPPDYYNWFGNPKLKYRGADVSNSVGKSVGASVGATCRT